MTWHVVDALRADHPDPDAERTLTLTGERADAGLVDADAVLPASLDGNRTESWDSVFASSLRASRREEAEIAFAVSSEAQLVTLFHAAATWLGIAELPLAVVRLHLAGETAGHPALIAAFAREKARHLQLHEIDLPEVDWLAPQHQYSALAGSLWELANGPGRPPELSTRQLFAIRLYTSEFYLAFHRGLRAGRGDDPVYRALLPIIACLDAGLENLPAVAETTFRGETTDSYTADARRALVAGSEFGELSYVSSSRDELHASALRRGFLFRIGGRTGRDVSGFSEFPWEKEVLFGRGLVQRVLSKDCSDRSLGEECDFETIEARPDRFDYRRR